MIHEQDVLDAIAECQGERNPNANTCIKLAAFLTIQRELFRKAEDTEAAAPETVPVAPAYSYAAPADTVDTYIDYYSDTEFGKAIDGKRAADVWPIMDELMSVLQATIPRLHDSVIRKIQA